LLVVLAVLRKFVALLDNGVYVRIALTGEGFCKAAKEAYEMVLLNSSRYLVLSGISGFFSLIGQIVITISSTYIGYIVFTNASDISDDVSSDFPTIFAFLLVSYLVANIFLSVYEMANDTIIQSFIFDEILNKGINLSAPQPLLEYMRDYKEDKEDD
jgi:Plasma-membrane choline transporter.